jgi:hypothetical protein
VDIITSFDSKISAGLNSIIISTSYSTKMLR